MQNINHVVIAGNLTRDPELKETRGGNPVLTFGMAVNDSRRNPQTGEYEDYPNFIDIAIFGNMAESMSRILHKGMKVTIDGKLRYTSWEKDGQKRSNVSVVAQHIELPPRQQQPQSQQGYAQSHSQPEYGAQTQQQGNYSNNDLYPEDLPF